MSRRQPRGRRWRDDPHPVRSRRGRDACADPEPAGDGRRAPPPGARGHAHEVRAGHRVRRRARGAPLRAAARLRRGLRQPVSGLRDPRRHDPPGAAAGTDAREGGAQLHQGAQQGHPEGDVQDGHLDAGQLLRRADLRGRRPQQGVCRPVLHLDAVAHRRRRAGRGLRGGQAPSRQGVPDARQVGATDLDWGGEYQWRRDGEYHLFNPETVFKLQHATRSGQYTVFKEYTSLVDDQATRLATLRGLFEFKTGAHAGAARRGRVGRVDRQALLHRRDVVWLDQRRKRTRRWPSR